MDKSIQELHDQNLKKSAESDTLPKEVLRPDKMAKQYNFRVYPPSASLVPFVDYYWIMRWDLQDKPFLAEIIPSPYTNLTFMPEGARITGVTTGKYTYKLKNSGVIIGCKFKPGALHAFYGKNVSDLTNTHIPAREVFAEVDEKFNITMMMLSDEQATKRLDNLLRSRKPTVDRNLQLVTRVINYISTHENPTLESVYSTVGLSERRLQEIFRESVGVSVKWMLLRARLIKAVELAARPNKIDWTSVAQDLGYADQSHFTNDFKRAVGRSPSQYASEFRRDTV